MVYARRQTRQKPLKSEPRKWPAPTQGWISNRALSDPMSIEGPGAAVLDDFFPRATGVVLRRGRERYATLVEQDRPVDSLFTYRNGSNEKMFGANNAAIYDLSNVAFPTAQNLGTQDGDAFATETGDILGWSSTDGLGVSTGYTGGDWSVVQFSTTGGIYLIGVNGEDTGFIYDGTEFWPNLAGGMWYLPLTSEAAAFINGETVTGASSGATATVYRDETARLVISGIVETTEVHSIAYSGLTGTFTVGSTLTGGTSNASAKIASDSGTVLTVTNLNGDFQASETISDGAGATATADAPQSYVSGGPFRAGETINGGIAGSAVVGSAIESAIPGMGFGGIDTKKMSFVWTYKNRLWFIEKDSLSAWYMPIDAVGGPATEFPMGGIFANGGKLLFGARWSLASGGDGGLSEQNVFVTSSGETAIYQGSSPDEAADWSIVGVYRVGTPLGKRAYLRGGGDLAIATTVGLVPLSKAIELDVTALNVATVSYKIADAWTDAIRLRGPENWQAMIWSESKLAAIAPPDVVGSSEPVVFITNTETGAWARYTNWQANCMEVYKGQLYFGSVNGGIFKANVGGSDDGDAYTGAVIPLFDDMGTPASLKVSTVARAVTRSTAPVVDRIDVLSDYSVSLPPAPDATSIQSSNTWGTAVWGNATWGATQPDYVQTQWRSSGQTGYKFAPCYQVTSGSVAALDLELIEMNTLHTTGGVVS